MAFKALYDRKELAQRSEATLEIVVQHARNVSDFCADNMRRLDPPVSDFTADVLERYAKWAMRTRKRHTASKEIRTLREAIRCVVGTDATPKAPDLGVVYQPRERVVEPDDFRKFLEACPVHWRRYFLFYYLTGARLSEAFRVTRKDVDFKAGEVRLRGHKGAPRHAIRWVPMQRAVVDIMREASEAVDRDDDPLLPKVTNRALRYWIRLSCREVGIEPFSLNDLRRSFATLLARDGMPEMQLKKLMGHAPGSKMLEHVYAQIARGKHMHDAIATLPDFNMEVDGDDDRPDPGNDRAQRHRLPSERR